MNWDKERIAQLQLPDPADDDPHPRLLLEGEGVHAGQGFTALFPDGWHDLLRRQAFRAVHPRIPRLHLCGQSSRSGRCYGHVGDH